ncbi:MAG: hypothetical protein V1834_00240 [Candidatus Micrarchaeota archaeon]
MEPADKPKSSGMWKIFAVLIILVLGAFYLQDNVFNPGKAGQPQPTAGLTATVQPPADTTNLQPEDLVGFPQFSFEGAGFTAKKVILNYVDQHKEILYIQNQDPTKAIAVIDVVPKEAAASAGNVKTGARIAEVWDDDPIIVSFYDPAASVRHEITIDAGYGGQAYTLVLPEPFDFQTDLLSFYQLRQSLRRLDALLIPEERKAEIMQELNSQPSIPALSSKIIEFLDEFGALPDLSYPDFVNIEANAHFMSGNLRFEVPGTSEYLVSRLENTETANSEFAAVVTGSTSSCTGSRCEITVSYDFLNVIDDRSEFMEEKTLYGQVILSDPRVPDRTIQIPIIAHYNSKIASNVFKTFYTGEEPVEGLTYYVTTNGLAHNYTVVERNSSVIASFPQDIGLRFGPSYNLPKIKNDLTEFTTAEDYLTSILLFYERDFDNYVEQATFGGLVFPNETIESDYFVWVGKPMTTTAEFPQYTGYDTIDFPDAGVYRVNFRQSEEVQRVGVHNIDVNRVRDANFQEVD